uniref:carboxylesterase/lipase family protein n=1 Tax=Eubacterium cellulosolvens TaxID=29322 RepID=UPI0009DDAD9A|nr:carboxylesterase family protein [[Eubacterium] cellulosolvens]
MKKSSVAGKLIFYVALILTGLVFFAVLELNKNIPAGWSIMLLLFVVFAVLYRRKLSGRGKLIRTISWLCLFASGAVVVLLTQGPYRLVPAVPEVDEPKQTGIVHVAQGDIRGVLTGDETVEMYTGIPYAKPPVGDLRWKEPQDPEPWEGVKVCDHFAPMSMQPSNSRIYDSLAQIIGYHDYEMTLRDDYRTIMSEDSLYINIWKPAGDVRKAPVLVYVHGGSLKTGQPWYDDYSGRTFAKDGVVVVNMAYRLGVFGYYADEALAEESSTGTTGNYGLLDQIKALEWVRDNIEAFGGNPEDVTLAGESAGSASVSALCASPMAKGLFTKVIAESSSVSTKEPPHSFRLMEQALADGADTRAALGIGEAAADGKAPDRSGEQRRQELAGMRELPAEKLVGMAEINHHITVDGRALAKTPWEYYRDGQFNETALFNGYNRDEAAPFVLFDRITEKNLSSVLEPILGDYTGRALELYPVHSDREATEAYEKIFSVFYFGYSHYTWTRQTAEKIPVYEYWFTKENGRLGAWHSGEEVYLYGNIPVGKQAGASLYTDEDLETSEVFHSYALNFIRTGDPNGESSGSILPDRRGKALPVWKRSGTEGNVPGENVQEIGGEIREVQDENLELFRILDELYG